MYRSNEFVCIKRLFILVKRGNLNKVITLYFFLDLSFQSHIILVSVKICLMDLLINWHKRPHNNCGLFNCWILTVVCWFGLYTLSLAYYSVGHSYIKIVVFLRRISAICISVEELQAVIWVFIYRNLSESSCWPIIIWIYWNWCLSWR